MNLEQAFNTFVKQAGGELVSELLPKSPSIDNADYLFRNQGEPVVAELKSLTKDLLREGYEEKLGVLYEDWIKRGLIMPFAGRIKVGLRDLPKECLAELSEVLGKTIKRHIYNANGQIKETKEHFGLQNAKGLLLLANDGNYSLESAMVKYLANREIGQHYSGINSVVYFTVNMAAEIPGIDRDVSVWLQAHRTEMPAVSAGFLDWLREGWIKFHERMLGERIPVINMENHSLDLIKFVRPPEPREYYRTRNSAFVNLRREIMSQVDRMISSCRLYDCGKHIEAREIAAAIAMLLPGKKNFRSLVRDYMGNQMVRLTSTTMISPSEGSVFLGFLAFTDNVQFKPFLDATKSKVLLPFQDWWEKEPVMRLNKLGDTITRKEIILGAIRNAKDSHLDEASLKKYQHLETGLGFTAVIRAQAGELKRIPFRNADLAAIRQIAHELLISSEFMALVR